jgi:DNA polymerase III subunit alpha
MTEPKFVHLHVHSDYSIRDGLLDVAGVVKTAKAKNMAAIAITDFMNQCNTIKLLENTESCGMKPVFGIELCVLDDTLKNNINYEYFELTLLALNDMGYRNIVELQSNAWRQGDIYYHTCVRLSWLDKYSEGVIVLSGGINGDVGKYIISDRLDLAEERLDFYQKNFPNRYYFELSRLGQPNENKYIAEALKLAVKRDLPVVATNKVVFAKQDDYEVHRIRVAIQDKVTIDDKKWIHPYTDQMYMKTEAEMESLFSDIPEALENSVEIAKRCTVHLHIGANYLPKFPTGNLSPADYLRTEAYTGLEERLEFLYPDKDERDKKKPTYLDRLERELSVIIKMDFPGYFLIVMEFIQWSKKNGVPVGPGRGSGCGSLVAYAIKITDLDPLKYDLLFERFLNPERVSMPDFDVDFCMDNRGRVIQHVADTYGRQSVSQIITFGTLAAKASVKAVSRVIGKSYSFGDKIAKMIPTKPDITLNKALNENEDKSLKNEYDTNEEVREVIDIALRLEGLTNSHGKHAGGVVISPTVISDFAPLMCDYLGKDFKTQFDKHDVEEAGLVKFDFLGLKTLTIIDWALDMINARLRKEGKPEVNIAKIDLADKASYDVLKSTETTAVFQLESNGMRDLIGKMQPDCIEDMIALVALYRPGPLDCGMVDNFVNRKHGREKVAYPSEEFQHECLEPILKPTYGIVVYQEQVMQIAQALAGYSLGGADLLRRAMGKKKPEEMAKQRSVFKKGAEAKGIDGELAMKIFDQVEKFAGYGFNKSHSAAYGIVAFETLWLKTHFPAEYLAAMMTAEKENAEKIVIYINECRRLRIKVNPPDVNQGEIHFVVNSEGHIIFSLGAIKGVGEGPVSAIMAARKTGPFKNLFDFCRRVDSKYINRRVMEALVWAGALDNLGPNRASTMATLDVALLLAAESTKNRSSGMLDLFEDDSFASFNDPPFEDVQPFSDKVWLKGEVDTLGLYLTGHPIDRYSSEIEHLAKNNIGSLTPSQHSYGEDKELVTVVGIVDNLCEKVTKGGLRYLTGYLLDYTGKVLFQLWKDDYLKYKDIIKNDMLLVVSGSVGYDNFNKCNKIYINNEMNIVEARMELGRALRIAINDNLLQDRNFVKNMTTIIDKYPGDMQVELLIQTKDSVMIIKSAFTVEPLDELIDELKYKCTESVYVDYAK